MEGWGKEQMEGWKNKNDIWKYAFWGNSVIDTFLKVSETFRKAYSEE